MVRERLADDGLEAYPVTSGSKGIQLYAPISGKPGRRRGARLRTRDRQGAGGGTPPADRVPDGQGPFAVGRSSSTGARTTTRRRRSRRTRCAASSGRASPHPAPGTRSRTRPVSSRCWPPTCPTGCPTWETWPERPLAPARGCPSRHLPSARSRMSSAATPTWPTSVATRQPGGSRGVAQLRRLVLAAPGRCRRRVANVLPPQHGAYRRAAHPRAPRPRTRGDTAAPRARGAIRKPSCEADSVSDASTRGTGRPRVAVVGSGVAGLTAAYLLRRSHRSPCSRPTTGSAGTRTPTTSPPATAGRRARRHRLHRAQRAHLPHLLRLFAELGVTTQPTEMSMASAARAAAWSTPARAGCAGCSPSRRRLARARASCGCWPRSRASTGGAPAARRRTPMTPDDARPSASSWPRAATRRTSSQHFLVPLVARGLVVRTGTRCSTRPATCSGSSTTTAC